MVRLTSNFADRSRRVREKRVEDFCRFSHSTSHGMVKYTSKSEQCYMHERERREERFSMMKERSSASAAEEEAGKNLIRQRKRRNHKFSYSCRFSSHFFFIFLLGSFFFLQWTRSTSPTVNAWLLPFLFNFFTVCLRLEHTPKSLARPCKQVERAPSNQFRSRCFAWSATWHWVREECVCESWLGMSRSYELF